MKNFLKIAFTLIGKRELLTYFILGVISGFLNFLFINCVTRIVSHIASGNYVSISQEYVIIFFSVILLFVWVKRSLSLLMMKVSQRISWSLRRQILSLVLNSNYSSFVGKRHRIDAVIVNDVNTLTGSSIGIVDFGISVIIVVSCFIYLLTISATLFLITVAVAAIGVFIYSMSNRKNIRHFQRARSLENEFQENFGAIMNGYKEIYIEPEKGRYIFDEKIRNVANESYKINLNASTRMLNNSMIGQIMFYLLTSSVLLVFSVLLKITPGNTISFAFTLTYLLGSLEAVTLMIPMIMRAGVAASNLMQLKDEMLRSVIPRGNDEKGRNEMASFKSIKVNDLEFYYGEQGNSFGIGPINCEIEAGEVVFIYGGNGSGKTTFIYSLLGLYNPVSGYISTDTLVIDQHNYPQYRSMFAVVFSDYYLFNELVTKEAINADEAADYLRIFELEKKVTIEGRKFSTTELSAGQRKRLALIAAVLEGKKILVLDEWAADQDPYFRNKFYTIIIPLLKKKGITIVAVTHDDKYYYCADKLFRMEEGKITQRDIAVYDPGVLVNN